MQTKTITKATIVRCAVLYAALLFCAFSLVFFTVTREFNKAFMSFVSILYVFIPNIAEKLFKFRISPTLYVFVVIYASCPLLGYSYDFYYHLPWWDDILHAFAGVIFAMFGAYLPKVLNKDGEPSVALCAFCAFFFSVAIAGLWELGEFSMDSFFGTDMQKDTELFAMRPSYVLSEILGAPVGTLQEMHEVQIIIDGQALPGNTYVDLGIIDTMKDIFVETLGAAVYVIMYRAGNGKHFIFEKLPETETEELTEELAQPVGAPVGVVAEVAASEAIPAENGEEPVQLTIDEE